MREIGVAAGTNGLFPGIVPAQQTAVWYRPLNK